MKDPSGLFLEKTIRHYLLLGLISLELLMSFSFLGYLHVSPISLSFAYLPILLAGCLLGPADAVVIGVLFGLASLWKASASYVAAGDQIFSPFLSGRPAASLFLSIGTRALFAFLIGLLYSLAKRAKTYRLFWIGLVSFFGKSLHSFLVYGAMGLLFPEMGLGIGDTFRNFWSANNLILLSVTVLFVLAGWRFCSSAALQQYQKRMSAIRDSGLSNPSFSLFLFSAAAFMFLFSGAVAFYFVNRMNYMLREHGVTLSAQAAYDLAHLQIQFLLGILSLSFLVTLVLIFLHRHIAYRKHEANTDNQTGLLNRNGFFHAYRDYQNSLAFSPNAAFYFLILDIDHFKQINDRYGHPAGDQALRKVAACLRETFGDLAIIGRLGGDEFMVFFHTPVSRERLVATLQRFARQLKEIAGTEGSLSCSIGAVPVTAPTPEELLYQRADEALYTAKKMGRDRYVITNMEN